MSKVYVFLICMLPHVLEQIQASQIPGETKSSRKDRNLNLILRTMPRKSDMTGRKQQRSQKDVDVGGKKAVQEDEENPAPPKSKMGKAKLSRKGEEVEGSSIDQPATKTRRRNRSSGVEGSTSDKDKRASKSSSTRKKKQPLNSKAESEDEESGMQEEETQAAKREVGGVDPKKPWLTLAHKKPSPEWVIYDPDTMRRPALPSSVKSMKLLSWNVNGLCALMKKRNEFLVELVEEESFDVICMQETKLQEKEVERISTSLPPEYCHSFWNCSTAKLGYAGSALISKVKPILVRHGLGIPHHDQEGRLITAEFDKFYLVAGYVPNAGQKLENLEYRTGDWDSSVSQYLKELEKKKPVIYAGDLNCATDDIDISNPAGNRRNAGFTNEERESFKTNYLEKGFVDTFRQQHPKVVGYTFWSYRSGARSKNNGWRLDYFLASEGLMDQIHDSYMRPDVIGSDHCPIGLIVKV
ncbi:hypothetical protein R1sor_000069 [Riccia sorocarpa]|uniref:DNA-(apurinic or apyrimidinic site) endonuclease n=1 Tax=Riccia sorocarpa TaxID=122646 RepID=A0ABD3GUE0_9MARC